MGRLAEYGDVPVVSGPGMCRVPAPTRRDVCPRTLRGLRVSRMIDFAPALQSRAVLGLMTGEKIEDLGSCRRPRFKVISARDPRIKHANRLLLHCRFVPRRRTRSPPWRIRYTRGREQQTLERG